MTAVVAGKTYKTNLGGEFTVFYVGEKRIFGRHTKVGEISLEPGNILGEIKTKRTITRWVNIYEQLLNPAELRIGSIDYDTFEEAAAIGKQNQVYIDTISITYKEK
jgi:hypothetical protein